MIDALFTVALMLIFVLVMWWCHEAWNPKPYTKVHMRCFAKRMGK